MWLQCLNITTRQNYPQIRGRKLSRYSLERWTFVASSLSLHAARTDDGRIWMCWWINCEAWVEGNAKSIGSKLLISTDIDNPTVTFTFIRSLVSNGLKFVIRLSSSKLSITIIVTASNGSRLLNILLYLYNVRWFAWPMSMYRPSCLRPCFNKLAQSHIIRPIKMMVFCPNYEVVKSFTAGSRTEF